MLLFALFFFFFEKKPNCFFSYERLCGWIVNSFLLHLHLLERLHLPIYEPLATLAGSFWNFSTLCSHCLYRFTRKFNPRRLILKETVRLAYVGNSQCFPWDLGHFSKNHRKMSNNMKSVMGILRFQSNMEKISYSWSIVTIFGL